METITVDVLITTYNHEKFIAEAIESVLAQKTNFKVRMLIGDDCSTDRTCEILRAYKERYPEQIQLFLQEVNHGPDLNINGLTLYKNATARYVAILDGDDYWTYPGKLQEQVDFLERNTEYILCHHWQKNAYLTESGEYAIKEWPRKEEYGYQERADGDAGDIFTFKMRPQTRTLLFRNILINHPFPPWYYKVKFGDLALCFVLGKHGKFHFVDEDWAVYRVHSGGVSSLFKSRKGFVKGNKAWIVLLAHALKHNDFQYVQQAMIGIQLLLDRIIRTSKHPKLRRINLFAFLILGTVLTWPLKLRLVRSILR